MTTCYWVWTLVSGVVACYSCCSTVACCYSKLFSSCLALSKAENPSVKVFMRVDIDIAMWLWNCFTSVSILFIPVSADLICYFAFSISSKYFLECFFFLLSPIPWALVATSVPMISWLCLLPVLLSWTEGILPTLEWCLVASSFLNGKVYLSSSSFWTD